MYKRQDVDRVSHVVRFAATIGQRDTLVTTRSIFSAMPPDHHPAEGRTIDIELIGSERKDHEEAYWTCLLYTSYLQESC